MNIRKAEQIPLSKKIWYTGFILLCGISLGIISKFLDMTAVNGLPSFLQTLDLGIFFSRLGVWIFLGTVIAVYSKSPLRAGLNVFLFFAGMVASYYVYTVAVAGFFPKSYMMIWVFLTFLSPIMAGICWYAKGDSIVSIIISSVILMVMASQTFVFGFWYWDLINPLELLLWIATILVLYQSPRQIAKVIVTGMFLFLIVGSRIPLLY